MSKEKPKESLMPHVIAMAIRITVCFFTAYFYVFEKPINTLYMLAVGLMCVSGFMNNWRSWIALLDKDGK